VSPEKPKTMKKTIFFLLANLLLFISQNSFPQQSNLLSWPEITTETRPWTRWWWMGSAVNKADLTAAMEKYKKAGLGGLEITPIYGVKGYEDQFIQYLSPEWMDMLEYTLNEADRLGLGIDMATGTGWPFGGPWVTPDDACKDLASKTYILNAGETLNEPVEFIQEPLVRTIGRRMDISELSEPISANKDLQSIAPEQIRYRKPLPLQVLMAYSNEGYKLDLTKRVGNDGKLNWIAPAGTWTLYALFQGWHGKMVERAAPGGEGDVIDHFSEKAISHYLDHFDKAFTGKNVRPLRAFFNDSYEVDDARGQADWTPDLPAEFQKRCGYSIYDQLPALLSKDSTEKSIRVLCDYRSVISDLLRENFTSSWKWWAKQNDAIIRNQAHGSPANILDLYAVSDIPETEGTDIQAIKMASSAANVTGKNLTSSESATWLNEHFLSSLADVKANVDNFFLGGVNHVFYHGTTYSPQNDKWPGWMFYAAVHFGPTNSFWNDFPALNKYVARCQSFLQSGKPDNDILFYYPFCDLISVPARRGLLEHFDSDMKHSGEPSFYSLAQSLLEQGYTFDYISDLQLIGLQYDGNCIKAGSSLYKTIVVPESRFIPLETFNQLFRLAEQGAVIIIQHSLPKDVPGLWDLEQRQMMFKILKDQLDFKNVVGYNFSRAGIGTGSILMGDDLNEMLSFSGIKREKMVDGGLQFIRRQDVDGPFYFIVNRSSSAIDGWIPIRDKFQSAGLFNPSNGKYGLAGVREGQEGQNEIYLQLNSGESIILKTFYREIEGSPYTYLKKDGDVVKEIGGKWKLSFISGGPELPKKTKLVKLCSWTDLKGEAVKNFSGTARYSISFGKPEGDAQTWILNLGRVAESARVRLNGEEIAVLIGPHYYVEIPVSKMKEKNLLEIDVSNLMANRIAALDKQSGDWKKFYNVNFPSKLRENMGPDGLFNASKWPPRESGLIGPVVLIPMKIVEF
jgi:hypothetical protein